MSDSKPPNVASQAESAGTNGASSAAGPAPKVKPRNPAFVAMGTLHVPWPLPSSMKLVKQAYVFLHDMG